MLREDSQASSEGSFATRMSPWKQAGSGEANQANRRGAWSCRSDGTRRLPWANWSGPATPSYVLPDGALWTSRVILLRFLVCCVACNRRAVHHEDTGARFGFHVRRAVSTAVRQRIGAPW